MPVLHKYKENNAHYILTSVNGKIVTFQLTIDGYTYLREAGVITGRRFNRNLLLDIYRMGYAYTGHTGTETIPGQGMLDFSRDPEPEIIFPSCSICGSLEDLHIVELIKEKSSGSILCSICRKKERSSIDTSIPLQFVTRIILKRFIDLKNIAEIDASVSSYQNILEKEFSEKWKELEEKKRKKPVQETLIDGKNSGTLI